MFLYASVIWKVNAQEYVSFSANQKEALCTFLNQSNQIEVQGFQYICFYGWVILTSQKPYLLHSVRMNILDSIWDSIFWCWIKCGILVSWVFASWKMNGGNWWASHLCKGKPNFGCATLVRWRVMTFFLHPKDWQLLPLFCKTLCLNQG